MCRPRPSITSGSFSSLITRVSTGVRPGGISSIRLTSISPYWVSVSVRGIGVAVITSRCGGCSALDASSSRCETPKRCCSSITASPRLLVGDLLLEDRVGADEDVDRAVGEAHQHAVARPALLAAGEDRDAHAEAVELAEQGRVMLAGEDFGRREQRRLRAAIRPRPASPAARPASCPSRRRPGAGEASAPICAMSPRISSITRRCAPVSW